MKILKRIMAAALLAVLWAGLFVMPAAANMTFSEHDGLEILVEMDKEQYDDNDLITATITVTNTNPNSVTIANAEQLIPNGYRLAENSDVSMKNIELRPAQTMVLKVTFEKIPAREQLGDAVQEDFWGKLIYGETWGIPNLLIIVVLVIAFVIFMILT